jgi:hypothetical protein
MNRTLMLAALAATVLLAGCAGRSSRLYDWGAYDDLLYRHYKDASRAAETRASLEAHIAQAEANKQKVPPGLYAEVGTLYLQANDRAKSIDYYRREQEAWPESAGMMKAMIATLERREARSENEESK